MNRRFLLTTLLCAPMALGLLTSQAESKPQWEEQWYPVKDGREDKLYVRFGSEDGLRLRQWGNGYKVKVDFTATITYGAQNGDGNAKNTTMEVVSLEPGGYSAEDNKYIQANAELLDITAVIQ